MPTEIATAALHRVTTYNAVEKDEFLRAYVLFMDAEEADMREKFAARFGSSAADEAADEPVLIDVDQCKELMLADGENFFPWAIGEAVGGMEEKVDAAGYVAAFRMLRKNYGFTAEERENLFEVYDKFDPDEEGIETKAFRRVLKYLGYELPQDQFNKLVEAVDQDQTGIIDRDEWLSSMRIFNELQLSTFKHVFDTYDMDGSAYI